MLINLVLYAAALLLMLPVLLLSLQIALACLPGRRTLALTSLPFSMAVLVPAHDEAAGIAATLKTILPQLETADRLLVVADNCSDNTADIARACGAEVIERHDSERRGKGHALDFGLRRLAQQPPDVLLVIDADCKAQDNSLRRLAGCALQHRRPVQCLYLMSAGAEAGLKTRIAEFAWRVKNWVRPLGYARAGLPCQLMGSGMAFPWAVINAANLAHSNIVEDMQLGLDLCSAGTAPLFYPDALVSSRFPASSGALAVQRTRWEHGHLGMIFGAAPRLLWQACLRRDKNLCAMALDLCVPPLALLVTLLIGLLGVSGSAALAGTSPVPFLLLLATLTLLALAIALAWRVYARNVISLRQLLAIPLYILAKIPGYFAFLYKRQRNWIRTERE